MVSARNWLVINNQKFRLPQVSSAHLPYHDHYFPIIVNSEDELGYTSRGASGFGSTGK